MTLPDYEGGSIVNLMRSLGDACGADAPLPYAPLRGGKVSLRDTAKHIVLLVIDGLGCRYLEHHGAGSRLQAHLQASLTSVFPSTTASAVTTFLSGLAPQQHALTGWHMYFDELGTIAAVLPLRPRSCDRVDLSQEEWPARLFGHRPFVGRIARTATFVSPREIADSPFNRYHSAGAQVIAYATLEELFGAIVRAVRQAEAPSYTHAYFSELDSLAHVHGIGSEQVSRRFAELDRAFGKCLDALAGSDTLLVACADHGFIDSPPGRQIDLAEHPDLAATLARPLCGERRVAYCYVRPGQAARFEAEAARALDGRADCYRADALVARGWFGPGAPDPRLAARIGDYVLVMRDNWTLLDWVEGEKRYRQFGVHAGVSKEEMIVPLVVADCAG